ncbi:MAG TPA: hypothetical protein PLI42_00740 [Candidatus Pacearchaeota archaeon]|nr:hypothetical protein [Candidatus Pacearchaeota archaeon]HOS12510.1 hypothetical protein [Candidatus Pacearchaeota archaeon]
MAEYAFGDNQQFIKIDYVILKAVKGDYATAAFLQHVWGLYQHWEKTKQLTKDGYFFLKVEAVEEKLCISKYVQQRIIKTLKEANFIDISYRGLPRQRYIKVNKAEIEKLYLFKETQAIQKALEKKVKDKKERQEIFYKNLDTALESFSYKDIYRQGGYISNDVIVTLYLWKKLSKEVHNINWHLNAKDFGILKYWVKQFKDKKQPVNFALLFRYFKTTIKENINVPYFKLWYNAVIENFSSDNKVISFNSIKEAQEFVSDLDRNIEKHNLALAI